MKYFLTLLLTLLFISPSISMATTELQAGKIDPGGQVISVDAKGLVCDFCAQALEKVFMKRPEVSGIGVDLDNAKINIALKKGTSMTDEMVTDLIVDSGYNVGGISRQKAAE